MSNWLLVWLIVALVTTTALAALAIWLVRHLQLVGRTAGRARDEIAPLAEDISRESARASDRAGTLRMPAPSGRRRGRR